MEKSKEENSYFTKCYAGCKLEANTLRWRCKIFDDVKDADKYALHDFSNSKATKLLTIPCFYKKDGYTSILKSMVGSHLYFGLDFEQDDGKIM
jgi:hypothetical protein